MATHVGFRLTKTDADIEKALTGFEDKTKRVKDLIRLGLAVERGEWVPEAQYAEVMGELEMRDKGASADSYSKEEIVAALVENREPIQWKPFPKSSGNPSKPFYPAALQVKTK